MENLEFYEINAYKEIYNEYIDCGLKLCKTNDEKLRFINKSEKEMKETLNKMNKDLFKDKYEH